MIQLQAIGRLGKDAEVKEVNSKKIIEFSISVDQGFGDRKTTIWLSCSKWGENTAVAQYLVKGTQVHVQGEPSLNTYTNKEGKEVTTLRLSCSQITLCGGKGEVPTGPAQQTAPTTVQQPVAQAEQEDLPF